MMRMKLFNGRAMRIVALSTVLSVSGCASFVDAAFNTAGQTAGEAVGKQVGESIARSWSPFFLQWYTGWLFGMAFHSGGYAITEREYKPGEWTRWEADVHTGDDAHGSWMERAYLFDDDEGNQFWRVKFHDGKENETVILEAMFDKERVQVKRLRGKFPKDQEGKEMPVDEATYYVPPRKLTDESIKGATKGNEKVNVPAGGFDARIIEFGTAGHLTQTWWANDGVPGGVVKYREERASNEEKPDEAKEMDHNSYTLLLQSHGDGAKSELGMTP